MRALILLGIPGLVIGMGSAAAQTVSQEDAMRAAIHPVGDAKAMQAWLSRVPVTREFPDDLTTTLRGHGAAFVKIGRANVGTPVTNEHLVCRLQIEKKK